MTYYAVIFDNDPEAPGVAQFCNVSKYFYEDDSDTENITSNYDWAVQCMGYLKDIHDELNYRVVEVIIKELESTK